MKRLIILTAVLPTLLFAQMDELEKELTLEMGETIDYAGSAFLSENVILGKSTTFHEQGGMSVRFKHHFGYFKGGAAQVFGLNDASVYMEFGYAPLDWMNLNVGYGTYQNAINANGKFRLLRQSSGKVNMPINLALYGAINLTPNKMPTEAQNKDFAGRLEYTAQLLASRRFCDYFSLQVMPTYIHRNLVPTPEDKNDLFAVGVGAKGRILKNLHLNVEYYWVSNHNTSRQSFYDPFSIGLSYQTSRHTFELFVTNAEFMQENYFIGNTTGNFWKGDIRLGFNVAINFTVGKKHLASTTKGGKE